MISDNGGGGLAIFRFFLTRGKVGMQISDFRWQNGRGFQTSIFGWHPLWIAPKVSCNRHGICVKLYTNLNFEEFFCQKNVFICSSYCVKICLNMYFERNFMWQSFIGVTFLYIIIFWPMFWSHFKIGLHIKINVSQLISRLW